MEAVGARRNFIIGNFNKYYLELLSISYWTEAKTVIGKQQQSLILTRIGKCSFLWLRQLLMFCLCSDKVTYIITKITLIFILAYHGHRVTVRC